MFALDLDGLDETRAAFDRAPAALSVALTARVASLAAALADRVRTEKLSGGALAARSGALRESIVATVSADGDGVAATIDSTGDVRYAAIQEYGGKTAAHEILPTKAQAVAFAVGGAMRFARRVEHPGSAIPERAYLRSTLAEASDEIVAALADAASESLGA